MKKLVTLLKSLLPMLAGIGVQLVVAFGVGIAYTLFYSFKLGFQAGSEGKTLDIADTSEKLTNALISPEYMDIATLMIMLVSVLVFSFWYFLGKPQKSFAKLSEVFHIRNIGIIIVVGIAFQFACSSALNLILPLFPKVADNYSKLIESLVGGNEIIAVVTTVICAPLAEEFIFRGLILKQLRKEFPFFAANLIQALLFGIYHMNIVQGVYAFVLGLLFGYFVKQTRSIWSSVALHAVVNGSAVLLQNILPESETETSSIPLMWIFLIVGTLVIVPLVLLIRKPAAPEAVTDTIDCPAEGILKNTTKES